MGSIIEKTASRPKTGSNSSRIDGSCGKSSNKFFEKDFIIKLNLFLSKGEDKNSNKDFGTAATRSLCQIYSLYLF